MRPAALLADASAAVSVSAATIAGLTLNEWAAVGAVAASVCAVVNYFRVWFAPHPVACSCPSCSASR